MSSTGWFPERRRQLRLVSESGGDISAWLRIFPLFSQASAGSVRSAYRAMLAVTSCVGELREAPSAVNGEHDVTAGR